MTGKALHSAERQSLFAPYRCSSNPQGHSRRLWLFDNAGGVVLQVGVNNGLPRKDVLTIQAWLLRVEVDTV